MIGIKAVAKYIGVSPSTVSRTISGNAFVAPETKKRVLAAIKELNYKPNIAARSLKSGSSKLIGLIIPDIMNPYYPQVVKSLEDCAVKAGYSLILCSSLGDIEREKNYFEALQYLFVDGILYIPSTEDISVAKEYMGNTPMVIINRTFDADVPCINIDNEDAAYKAISYLAKNGHRKIALYINDTNRQYNVGRLNGCKKAFKKYGIQGKDLFIVNNIKNEDDAFKRTKDLLSNKNSPTAIFIFNDYMAMSVYRGITCAGKKIPDDISVVGFDDIPTSKYLNPPLTTIRHSIYDTADVIFANLLYQINKQQCAKGSQTFYRGKLIIRDSVKKTT